MSSSKKQTHPSPHVLSIFLTLLSTLVLFLVILYNVPLSGSSAPSPGGRMWLVTIEPSSTSARGGAGGTKYGFGVWGWCAWKDGGGKGDCVRKSLWEVPDDAGTDAGVKALDLPGSVASSLSIASFFLIFNLSSAVGLLIALLVTFHFPARTQPTVTEKINLYPPKKLKTRAHCAYQLRNVWLRLSAVVSILAWGLPVIVVAGVGVGDLKDGLEGHLGGGWGLALAAMLMMLAVQGLILAGGLWNNPEKSSRVK
ncbi:hypothetical protein IAT38_005050 [Cryptococcus sp. DSM 104549]